MPVLKIPKIFKKIITAGEVCRQAADAINTAAGAAKLAKKVKEQLSEEKYNSITVALSTADLNAAKATIAAAEAAAEDASKLEGNPKSSAADLEKAATTALQQAEFASKFTDLSAYRSVKPEKKKFNKLKLMLKLLLNLVILLLLKLQPRRLNLL